MGHTLDLSRFQAKGTETCFHCKHINPQIYAGLDGSNWRLADYVARGGYTVCATRRSLDEHYADFDTVDEAQARRLLADLPA